MTHEEWLFENVLRDLESIASSVDEYQLLQGAGLVRQLLIDAGCLVELANREHQVQIRFRVAGPDEDFMARAQSPGVQFWSLLDALDPETAPRWPAAPPVHELKRDQFFHFRICRAGNVDYTVHDLVMLVANKMGGRHLDRSLSEKQRAFVELTTAFSPLITYAMAMTVPFFGGTPRSPLFLVCTGMRSIYSVVLKALQPLRAAIHTAAAGGAK